MSHSALLSSVAVATLALIGAAANADQVINDDLIVTSSICVGFDCVNGEDFGFDTLRLKENNTRIQFNDTSVGSFPTNNWQIRANSNLSGGPNFLGIVDQGPSGTSETGTTVLSVAANAGANALVVNAGGNVGFGNASPVVKLHATNGNTPTLRLEQNGTSGFTPQTWDLAGNEANFFLRDVTNASRLVFRVQPNAPSNSLFVAASGDVGVGTAAPSQPVHVRRTNGTAQILVEEAGAVGSSTLFRITSNARPIFEFENASLASNQGQWRASVANNGDFEINNTGVTGAIPVEFDMDKNGNLTLAGTVTAPSSRLFKADLTTVNGREVLAKLDAMPIVTWRYKNQSADNRHMGPVAEDFYEAFGLGENEQFIALNDLSGVALAAIKALSEEVQTRDAKVEVMAGEIALLKDIVAEIRGD